MKNVKIDPEVLMDILEGVETIDKYNGYYYSVKEALVIVILGSICRLKNTRQIHQWTKIAAVSEFLKENFDMLRKFALSIVKQYKSAAASKKSIIPNYV